MLSSYVKKLNSVRLLRGDRAGDAAARAKGYKESDGEYIAFLDSDNYWCPNKVQTHIDIWKSARNIGLSWDLCQQFRTTASSSFLSGNLSGIEQMGVFPVPYHHSGIIKSIHLQTELWFSCIIQMSTGFTSREVIESVGGCPEVAPFDYLLWLRISQLYDAYFVNVIMTYFDVSGKRLGGNKQILLREQRNCLIPRMRTLRRGPLNVLGPRVFFRRLVLLCFKGLKMLVCPLKP